MSENLQETNTQYFGYLLDIGLIDEEQFEDLCQKFDKYEKRQMFFEISSIFANFTASDWFDTCCRVYGNWQGQPTNIKEFKSNNSTKSPYMYSTNGEGDETLQKELQPKYLVEEQLIQREIVNESIVRRSEVKTKQSSYRTESTSVEIQNRSSGVSIEAKKLEKMFQILSKAARKAWFTNLKKHYYDLQLIDEGDEWSYKDQKASYRKEALQRSNDKSIGNSVEKDWHSKLYYDHFQKQALLEHKREIKKSIELESCTFVPQINPMAEENPALANMLKVPVYERLLQAKPALTNIYEKHEYRELKGATFHPDISKSQKPNRSQYDYKNVPQGRKRSVTERLYGDAQIKEKIMCLKQMNQKEQEIEGCTFSPKLVSPKKDKENFTKNQLSKSVSRLYEENLKRQRKLLQKEVEVREQELEGCTFQPDRPARGYKIKNEGELGDLEAHERLYERFKKKKRSDHALQDAGRSTSKETSQDANNARYRSNSVLEERIRKRSPKNSIMEDPSLNTPAFDRLYKEMTKRKLKVNQLKERVNKEEGITFQPKTNWSKKLARSISATNRSQQDIRFSSRYESKVSDGDYIKEPIYQYRSSERANFKRFG